MNPETRVNTLWSYFNHEVNHEVTLTMKVCSVHTLTRKSTRLLKKGRRLDVDEMGRHRLTDVGWNESGVRNNQLIWRGLSQTIPKITPLSD